VTLDKVPDPPTPTTCTGVEKLSVPGDRGGAVLAGHLHGGGTARGRAVAEFAIGVVAPGVNSSAILGVSDLTRQQGAEGGEGQNRQKRESANGIAPQVLSLTHPGPDDEGRSLEDEDQACIGLSANHVRL
jgi:hypothetical protein